MQFPLRLTADLAIGLATNTLRGANPHRLILQLAPVALSAALSSSPQAASQRKDSAPLRKHLRAARAQLCSRRWRLFSRLLETSFPAAPAIAATDEAVENAGTHACEESIEVS